MPEYVALVIIVLGALCVVLLTAVFVMLAIIMGLGSAQPHEPYYRPAPPSESNLWKNRSPR